MTLAVAPHDAPRARRTAVAQSTVAPSVVVPFADPLAPFTVAHFRQWATGLNLDTGEPWHLEPFQEAFVADLFSGVPECWLIVPEGNGKTTLVAGLALYHTEFRPSAFVAVAASSRDQAQVLYAQAEGFVLRSPRLHELVHSPIQEAKGKRKLDVPRFNPLPGYRRIDHHQGGRIQVYAADDATGDGLIPTLVILDELHRHRNLRLYRTWAGKLQKRQGQLVAISTAGEPGSEFELTRDRIRQQLTDVVRNGSFVRASSRRLVLHEWAVEDGADVEAMAVVKSANPFSGITVETLADKFASPTMTLDHWRRFVCDLPTRGENAAVSEAEWSAIEERDALPAGLPIWVGAKVTWKSDSTALVPFLMADRERRVFGPASVITPPRDGTSIDPDEIKAGFRAIAARNPIEVVVMDLTRAQELGPWIESELGARVIDWPQTNQSAVEQYERFMEALRARWLRHSGDPVLTGHVFNAIARMLPFGASRFDHPSQPRNTAAQDVLLIDALIAAAAVHCAAVRGLGEAVVPEFFTL